MKIFDLATVGVRTIIVATNIAESSITIADLDGIIDTLREKNIKESLSGGLRLSVDIVSKSSAEQRMGRLGRTGPGVELVGEIRAAERNPRLRQPRRRPFRSAPAHRVRHKGDRGHLR